VGHCGPHQCGVEPAVVVVVVVVVVGGFFGFYHLLSTRK
jgi:hypothetical protein